MITEKSFSLVTGFCWTDGRIGGRGEDESPVPFSFLSIGWRIESRIGCANSCSPVGRREAVKVEGQGSRTGSTVLPWNLLLDVCRSGLASRESRFWYASVNSDAESAGLSTARDCDLKPLAVLLDTRNDLLAFRLSLTARYSNISIPPMFCRLAQERWFEL